MTALILSFFLISSPILEDVAPVVYDFPSPESVYDAQTDSEDQPEENVQSAQTDSEDQPEDDVQSVQIDPVVLEVIKQYMDAINECGTATINCSVNVKEDSAKYDMDLLIGFGLSMGLNLVLFYLWHKERYDW